MTHPRTHTSSPSEESIQGGCKPVDLALGPGIGHHSQNFHYVTVSSKLRHEFSAPPLAIALVCGSLGECYAFSEGPFPLSEAPRRGELG